MGLNRNPSARDFGYAAVQYISTSIAYTDNGVAKTIGVVPGGSLILKPISGMHVTTAFNAGTNNYVDIGTSADDDLFGTDLSGASATFVPLDETIGGYYVAADTTMTVTVGLTGTAASAGAAKVLIAYVKL